MDLKELWKIQTRQQQLWHDWTALSEEDRVKLGQELIDGLYEEVAELQKISKRNRYHILKSKPVVSREDLAEAGVDVFKYIIAIMALNGVNADLFSEAFTTKTSIVEDRWNAENMELSGSSVLMCDLDECVAGWVEGFTKYLKTCGAPRELSPDLNHPDKEYWKNQFDMSGGYRNLPVIPGAKIALRALWAAGHKLVIVTARPYHRHRRVYGDTLEWLRYNEIHHDNIIFTRDKADAVSQLAPAKIVGFVEDRTKHAMEVAMAGVQVYKMPSPPNDPVVHHPNIKPVTGWPEIAYAILGERALDIFEAEMETPSE